MKNYAFIPLYLIEAFSDKQVEVATNLFREWLQRQTNRGINTLILPVTKTVYEEYNLAFAFDDILFEAYIAEIELLSAKDYRVPEIQFHYFIHSNPFNRLDMDKNGQLTLTP